MPILLYGCPIWGVPHVKNVIKLQVDQLPVNDKKEFVVNILNCIDCNISKDDIASIRAYTKNKELLVEVHDPILRNRIAYNAMRAPITFNVVVWGDTYNKTTYEMVHTKYCKFMLGVSKYESTTLVLGELGRYPLQNKVIR